MGWRLAGRGADWKLAGKFRILPPENCEGLQEVWLFIKNILRHAKIVPGERQDKRRTRTQ